MSRKPRLGTLLGGGVLLLALVDSVGAQMNRSLQSDVGALQTQLARSRTFLQVDNALVQLLARTAAEKDDGAIRALLARNGVTFRKGDVPAPSGETAK